MPAKSTKSSANTKSKNATCTTANQAITQQNPFAVIKVRVIEIENFLLPMVLGLLAAQVAVGIF